MHGLVAIAPLPPVPHRDCFTYAVPPSLRDRIAPGVRVRVPVSDPYQALLIPDEAVLADQGTRYVLVLGTDNVVLRRDIHLGRLLDDGMRVVLPGKTSADSLTPGDLVIVLGMQSARVNYPAEPVDAEGKPHAAGAAPPPPPPAEAATPPAAASGEHKPNE